MKPVYIIITLAILSQIALAIPDFHESPDITIEDLGWKKIVPDDHSSTHKDSAWIVTCKVTEGDKVRMHQSYGYYDYRFASKAFLLLIDPATIGVDFNGTILRFAGYSIPLPDSHLILSDKEIRDNRIMIGNFMDRSEKVRVTYMVESIPKIELERIAGKPQHQEGRENVTVTISPPREPIADK